MSYQDDEEGVTFDGTGGSFPKDFGYGGFEGEHEISPGDHKPRILLMGLRRFPKDFNVRKIWLDRLNLKEEELLLVKMATVCSDHFSSEDLLTNATGATVLKFNAVPAVVLKSSDDVPTFYESEDESNKENRPDNDNSIGSSIGSFTQASLSSGKSSIQKVVFHKMSPNETLFLESTNKIVKDDINNSSFVQFQIWDFPGQIDFFDSTFDYDMIFGGCGALIFVIDAQDDYMDALNKLNLTVTKAYKINQNIKFEVFIHKVDGLGDDFKMESQRDIHQRATDDLNDSDYDQIHLSFHLTSIYDHSIFEAFSKVVQKLIPQLPALENLLNILNTNSAIEKSFLFDVVSKIYIATDSTPVDMQSYELCCDMIDVVIDVSWIYGVKEEQDPAAFDEQSSSLIKLNNGTVLYLREVNKFLALVCILREDNFDHKGIIDYNFLCFRNAIQQVFELRNKNQHPPITNNALGSPIVNGNNIIGDSHLSPTLTDEQNIN